MNIVFKSLLVSTLMVSLLGASNQHSDDIASPPPPLVPPVSSTIVAPEPASSLFSIFATSGLTAPDPYTQINTSSSLSPQAMSALSDLINAPSLAEQLSLHSSAVPPQMDNLSSLLEHLSLRAPFYE